MKRQKTLLKTRRNFLYNLNAYSRRDSIMNYSDLLIECINLFKQANYEILIWIILSVVVILLFKQFKNDAERCRIKEEQSIIKYLVEYSEIVHEINRYKRNEISFDLLYGRIYRLLPICSENISNIIIECDINSSESREQVIKNIISEYKSLKFADVYGLSRKLTNKART